MKRLIFIVLLIAASCESKDTKYVCAEVLTKAMRVDVALDDPYVHVVRLQNGELAVMRFGFEESKLQPPYLVRVAVRDGHVSYDNDPVGSPYCALAMPIVPANADTLAESK